MSVSPTPEAKPLPAGRPTQMDVARLAGVSRATVSYVLNGQADGKVPISAETQARVQRAIDELGYVPDAGAQALRSGATCTIGLIIPDLRNPHFWQNAEGVELEARAAGYRLLLSSMDLNAAYGQDSFKDLSGRRIDALILMGGLVDQSAATQQILARCLKRRMPIVEIGDHALHQQKVDNVISDYRSATRQMVAHLLGLGHRRIALIYGVAVAEMGFDRLESYRDALQAAGIDPDEFIIHCGTTMEDSYVATRALLALPAPPTAIIAINDILAMGALRAISDAGLSVPGDISLAGFDDIPETRFLVPRLTTASKEAVRLGREAVRLALRRLQDPDLPRQSVEVPSQFIIRESTGVAPLGADSAQYRTSL